MRSEEVVGAVAVQERLFVPQRTCPFSSSPFSCFGFEAVAASAVREEIDDVDSGSAWDPKSTSPPLATT